MVSRRLAKLSKWKGVLAAGGGEGRFHSVPDDQDGGERAEEILAHRVEEAEILREQIVDGLKDELQEIGLHGSAPSTLGFTSAAYGMRKFWSESVSVPVTCAMLPARVAWRSISVLMVLVVASRCCLARMVCSSSKRSEQFVRVLKRAKGEYARGVDLVQDGDFGVEVRIVGERVLFEVGNLGLDVLGVAADRADGGHRVHVRAVGEFDGRILGLHAVEFVGRHAGELSWLYGRSWVVAC